MARGMHGRRDGHCSGRYASYWNAFLFVTELNKTFRENSNMSVNTCSSRCATSMKIVSNLQLTTKQRIWVEPGQSRCIFFKKQSSYWTIILKRSIVLNILALDLREAFS